MEDYGQLLFFFFQLLCDFQTFHNKCVLLLQQGEKDILRVEKKEVTSTKRYSREALHLQDKVEGALAAGGRG